MADTFSYVNPRPFVPLEALKGLKKEYIVFNSVEERIAEDIRTVLTAVQPVVKHAGTLYTVDITGHRSIRDLSNFRESLTLKIHNRGGFLAQRSTESPKAGFTLYEALEDFLLVLPHTSRMVELGVEQTLAFLQTDAEYQKSVIRDLTYRLRPATTNVLASSAYVNECILRANL